MSVKVLFIGGTGIISSACSQLAVEKGLDLCLLSRGTSARAVPEGAKVLHGDIRNPEAVRRALGDRQFDCVVDWVAFTPAQIETDLELFRGRAGQFVFISSASAYQKPPASLPITEGTILSNPFWAYAREKIACEERLIRAYRDEGFPATLVRPSQTYDQTRLPMQGGYTVIDRMRRGQKIVVAGDGTSLWTLTHHRDFAGGFVGLLGNARAVGEAFHITSDETVTWNQIHEIYAQAAGAEARLVHVPTDVIAAHDPVWGEILRGDKQHSMIFDNAKIKRFVPDFAATVPLSWGAREVIAWHDADPARQRVDPEFNRLTDRLIAAQEKALP